MKRIDLIVNRLRVDMVKRGDMMNVDDVTEILADVYNRQTLRSSALMGTISIVLAVLLDMVIPFHFG